MATPAQVHDWLAEVTYTPGSSLRLDYGGLVFGYGELTVTVRVEDSTGEPGRTIEVRHQRPAPPADAFRDRDHFRRWLADALRQVAMHESDEWFRDRATLRPVFDPHAAAS